jgi:hypothetical protein
MSDIAFNVRLAEADWDDTMSGWRCPALNVPGAKVEDIYVEGTRVDSAKYEVLQNYTIIRWAASDRPSRATASIILTRALSLGTETDHWRRLAIVLPVIATIIAALISGSATYLASRNSETHRPGTSVSATSLTNGSSRLTCEPDIDLNGMDYNSVTVTDLASCLKACRADAECKAYTFVPPGRNYAGCWLKTTRPPALYAPGLISGARAN